jgi:hypothetical protein
MYLIQERNNEILANLKKDQKRLISQWRKGVEPNLYNNQQQIGSQKIDWIESLYRKPLCHFRNYCIWRVFAPYFINIRRLSQSKTFDLIKDWLDRCNIRRRLDFDAKGNIKYALRTVKNYLPIGQDQLKMNGPFYSLLKMEGIVY